MSHVWTVRQEGKDLGTVEAVSRKGACHAAFEKFGIEQSKRALISVELLYRDLIRHRSGLVMGFDPAAPGREGTVVAEVGEDGKLNHVVCSFNPNLPRSLK